LHAILSRAKEIQSHGKGATVQGITIERLRAIQIPLPPLEEQRRIAAILDVVDELCRKRQRALHCLSQLGQAIFIEMFGDLLLSNEQAVALGEVCDVRDGTHDSPKYVDAGFPLLTSKNFSSGSIDYTGAKLIAEGDFTNINKRSRVDKGDIVMPMIGTIGGPVIVDFDPDFAIKNVALIKFTDSPMNPEFIREALDGRLFRSHVASLGRGGTQKFVSLGDIRCFKIPLPSVSQQNLFARRVCRLRAERARHSQALKISEALFSSLQYRALSGELEASRLKDADS
jgi:type I restriction enzyme S subunit